ncbi:receptor-like serine/threonine-protein kinase SD1-7 isoform X3 [Magnolia sinica]|uniref:receptor-like serine/threonine-protein kinase SD1-7 isoform X3 n=1 Tax=Magnolia sinica TaxID=86752 RepID=UPI00265A0C72|nr:receptor-like serine/threonine-protein kinase SD1-7 isoform X3 [Magnolia sinica]
MTSIILFFSFLPCICLLATASTNSITPTQPLTDGQILYSPNNYFQLKFFNPLDTKNRYVGIWCCPNDSLTNRFVWVANREKPLTDFGGVFAIQNGGGLVVLDGMKKAVWSSNTSYVMNNSSVAELLDSGNLVLREVNSVRVIWQSFDHLSDTLISGMKVGINLKTGETWTLRSWRNDRDPAPGSFTFGIDPQSLNQFFIWRRSILYWRGIFWNGTAFSSPPLNSFNYKIISSEDEVYFTILSPTDIDLYSFLVMKPEGIFEYSEIYSGGASISSTYLREDQCRVSGGGCGMFSSCNENGMPPCKCLPGFEPSLPRNWSSGDWTAGCRRRTPVPCRDLSEFILLKRVKLTPADYNEHMLALCGPPWVLHGCYSAYAFKNRSSDGDGDTCYYWSEGNLRGIIENDDEEEGSEWWDLYLGLTSSEFGDGGGNMQTTNSSNKKGALPQSVNKKGALPHPSHNKAELPLIVTVTVVIGILTLRPLIYCWWKMKDMVKGKRKNRLNGPMHQLGTHVPSANGFLDVPKKSNGLDVPLIDFESIQAATDNFSESNILGRGGFGTVYHGKLPAGEEIAVKRLSKFSGQGLLEFKNEVMLIAKLQHRNLVRLLGYCIEGDEKLLIYEYMLNKSLDFFLFDPNRCTLLDWEKRFNIILGISRGLVYLHQDSRLRIIHRDFKTSNILLDEEMNPKISDFGMARIFGGNQTQENTNRVVGTYGYMSPEYAADGIFSVKSDVFSFGIVLLEIISGKKNAGFYNYEHSLSLSGHAWRLWMEQKALDLVDPSLSETYNSCTAVKCINVGLLCVQENAADRPTMASIITMLDSETASLPTPKQPAFYIRSAHTTNSSNGPPNCSKNEVTNSTVEGR